MNIDINVFNFVPLVICFYIGYRYTGDYFEITDEKIRVFALVGNNTKEYHFSDYSDFTYDDDYLFLHRPSKKRIRLSRAYSNKKDWQELLRKLSESDLTKEIHDV